MQGLDLYVVYRNPKGFPGQYVVHKQTADRGTVLVDPRPLVTGLTLEAVRAALPAGVVRLERDPNDDPAIVEVWV